MEFDVTHPADEHIADLIKDLCREVSSWSYNDPDRQRNIDQIAQLRASMMVTVNVINQ